MDANVNTREDFEAQTDFPVSIAKDPNDALLDRAVDLSLEEASGTFFFIMPLVYSWTTTGVKKQGQLPFFGTISPFPEDPKYIPLLCWTPSHDMVSERLTIKSNEKIPIGDRTLPIFTLKLNSFILKEFARIDLTCMVFQVDSPLSSFPYIVAEYQSPMNYLLDIFTAVLVRIAPDVAPIRLNKGGTLMVVTLSCRVGWMALKKGTLYPQYLQIPRQMDISLTIGDLFPSKKFALKQLSTNPDSLIKRGSARKIVVTWKTLISKRINQIFLQWMEEEYSYDDPEVQADDNVARLVGIEETKIIVTSVNTPKKKKKKNEKKKEKKEESSFTLSPVVSKQRIIHELISSK